MQRTAALIWTGLLVTAATMGLLYLWYSLVPTNPTVDVLTYFSPQQVAEGYAFSRALRVVYIVNYIIQCVFLIWLIRGGRGMAVAQQILRTVSNKPIISSLLFFLLIWLSLKLLSLPFSFFSSFIWQHQWGFSTQTAASWLLDYFKSLGIELLIAGTGALLLFSAMRHLPRFWWLAAASFISVWIVAASYLWPLVVSPQFNRFTPVGNPAVTSMVKQLADKAGLPINEVLVMDASSRTTRANAYFAGVGETRRVVLYDNLLRDYPLDEVEAVIAHELAHWRQNHIVKGILWGILGNFAAWGMLFLLLRASLPAFISPPPHLWLFIFLFLFLGSFITQPIQNGISQQMEREADAVGIMLTENAEAAARLQVSLAVKNHSDIAPASYLRLFSTHPPAIERIIATTDGSRH